MGFFRKWGVWICILGLIQCTDGRLDTGTATDLEFENESNKREPATETLQDTFGDMETEDSNRETESSDFESDSDLDVSSDTQQSFCPRGFFYENNCWYLGEENEDCEDICENYGGYNPSTAEYIGAAETTKEAQTKRAHCENILNDLAEETYFVFAVKLDMWGLGFGCHLNYVMEAAYWVETPELDPTHKASGVARVCACGETF